MSRKRRKESTLPLPWETEREARYRERGFWKMPLALLLLAVLIGLTYRRAARMERRRQTMTEIARVHRALDIFRAEVGRCPKSTTELVHPPTSSARYLKRLPKDGWGKKLRVRCPGQVDLQFSDVISAGESGSFLVADNLW